MAEGFSRGNIAYFCLEKYSNNHISEIIGILLRTTQQCAKRSRVDCFNNIVPPYIKGP